MYDFLTKTRLFHGVSARALEDLLECLKAAQRNFRKGTVILHAGEETDFLGLVLSGGVHIESDDAWGNKTILDRVGPGEIFAETYACLPDEPLMVNVVAAENTSVLFLYAPFLMESCTPACAAHAQVIQNLFSLSIQKNLTLSRRIFHTAPRTIRGRLVSYLSSQSIQAGSRKFSVPFNRQQMADYLGVDRCALSAELSKMHTEGLLNFKKNRFELKGSKSTQNQQIY